MYNHHPIRKTYNILKGGFYVLYKFNCDNRLFLLLIQRKSMAHTFLWRNGPRRRDTCFVFRWWWHDGTVEMVYNMKWYEYIRKVFSVKGTIIRISLKFCLLARAFDYNKIILLCSWIKFYLYGKIFFLWIEKRVERIERQRQKKQEWRRSEM